MPEQLDTNLSRPSEQHEAAARLTSAYKKLPDHNLAFIFVPREDPLSTAKSLDSLL